jgi:hypothetical protein
MDALDKFFKKYAYKFPKGYPDLNDEQDINLLADLLENLGVKLNEAETQDFESFIKDKDLEDKTKQTISATLTDDEKSLIMSKASDNIKSILDFLNSNKTISSKLTNIKEGTSGTSLTGPGEIAIITCAKTAKKIASGFGDIELNGLRYELKEGKKIRAGGTYRPSITRLTTVLWTLKQEVFEGDNAEKYKEILGSELFNEWKKLGQIKGKEGEIDFTSIGKGKLTQVRNFFEKLRVKIKSLEDEDTSKPNVISVGSKDFEVSSEELAKIRDAQPGEDLALKGKVVISQESEATLTKLRQQLKILLSSKILTADEYDLDDAVKREFIKDVDGLIHVVNFIYTLYTQQEFIDKWEFDSLTQGNRPQFILKGTEPSEE